MILRYLLAILLALSINPLANATSNDTWEDISDVGVFTLMGTSLALPAAREDWEGLQQATYSLALTSGVTFLGKSLIHEERPDNSDNDSFPSGHTARAFAAATTLHRRYGWEIGFPAYALATLTGGARVGAKKHHWYDVVAGAAIGTASGWYLTDAFNDKVQLVTWADSKSVGITVAMRW